MENTSVRVLGCQARAGPILECRDSLDPSQVAVRCPHVTSSILNRHIQLLAVPYMLYVMFIIKYSNVLKKATLTMADLSMHTLSP